MCPTAVPRKTKERRKKQCASRFQLFSFYIFYSRAEQGAQDRGQTRGSREPYTTGHLAAHHASYGNFTLCVYTYVS